MALGGGTFVTANKKLPGSYINVVSAANASATLSDRGIAAMAFQLDWGKDNEVFEVTSDDFKNKSLELFGYDYGHEKMKGLRDLFLNIRTLYAYKLNSAGSKASNKYATAKFGGIRGNDLKIVIQNNVDDGSAYDVSTYIDTRLIETQTVKEVSELQSNDFVDFKSDFELELTSSTPLIGGSNGEEIAALDHQSFLNKIESYTFNAIGVVSEDSAINKLYSEFVKRLRDEYGIKCQSVTWNNTADYEGNINVKNETTDENFPKSAMCYWVTGIAAGCEVNKSNTNRNYDGEFKPVVAFTQTELENCIDNGEFVLHQVNSEIHVLVDINSLVSTSDDKGDVFKENQTIRVVDSLANSYADIFNSKYLGKIPNDDSGRISLWTDIVKIHNDLVTIRAIEPFDSSSITVEQGDKKGQVIINSALTVINAMSQLYATIVVE